MPFALLIPALLGALASIMASLVGRVLLALSLSFVTYTGFDTAIQMLYDQVQSTFGALPNTVINLIGYLWIDKAIGMVFSAFSAALLIKLAGGHTLTKLVMQA